MHSHWDNIRSTGCNALLGDGGEQTVVGGPKTSICVTVIIVFLSVYELKMHSVVSV